MKNVLTETDINKLKALSKNFSPRIPEIKYFSSYLDKFLYKCKAGHVENLAHYIPNILGGSRILTAYMETKNNTLEQILKILGIEPNTITKQFITKMSDTFIIEDGQP